MNDLEISEKNAAPFKAVLLYENAVTSIQTLAITEFAIGCMEPVISLDSTLWNISEIEIGSLSTFTEDRSAAAEVVVLSMRDGTGLSSSLRIWLNRWIHRRKGKTSVMVVLFDYPAPATDFARRHLHNAALRAGMNFFTQTGHLPEEIIDGEDLLIAV